MATLLMPLPDSDFDPTESGVPWRTMRDHGHNVVFATSGGHPNHDLRLLLPVALPQISSPPVAHGLRN
jgi:hypothetical protein